METNPMATFAEQMVAANQQMMSAAARLSQMAMEAEEEMLRHRMSSLELFLKQASIEAWKDVKTPSDFLAKSTEMSASYGQTMSEWMQKSMELQADIAKRMSDAIQQETTKTTSALMGKSEAADEA